MWGGIILGVVFLAAALTHGFGLLGGSATGVTEPELLTRQGDRILVPAGSALRKRLAMAPAPAEPVRPRKESRLARGIPATTPKIHLPGLRRVGPFGRSSGQEWDSCHLR